MNVRAGLHHRRSDRHAGASRGHRGRRVVRDPGAAHVPARQGDGRGVARRRSTPGSTGWPQAGDVEISDDFDRYLEALRQRHDFFHAHGLPALGPRPGDVLRRGLHRRGDRRDLPPASAAGKQLDAGRDRCKFKSAMLYEFGRDGRTRRAGRSSSTSARCGTTTRGCSQRSGPDTGFDSIGDFEVARPLARFLDRLDRDGRLAKTILYNLNPADNEVVATMIGNFQDGSDARQDAVRQRLVVPRSEGRHGAAARGAVEPRAVEPVLSACSPTAARSCQKIVSDFNGKVPDNMDELLKLNGVGRKTANVVLGNAFGVPGIVCDTHVLRLAEDLRFRRIRMIAVKLEFDLMEIVPKKNWTLFSHLLIFHGRNICKARKPNCRYLSDCKILPGGE